MADKRIDELEAASSVTTNDLFVLEQAGTAKKLDAQTLENWLLALAQGHGGIISIAKTGSAGTDPVVDTYTITFSDTTTSTFSVTNGLKGDQGDQTYVYIKYSNRDPIADSDLTDTPSDWMGICSTTASTAPTTYGSYSWYEIKGAKGDPGNDITIASTSVMYQAWTSGTQYPTGTWLANPPAVTPGNYLWTRTIVNYSDGGQTVSYSTARWGMDGSGAVGSVNNQLPDQNGNVTLTAANVGALPDSYQPPVTSVNNKTGTVVIDNDDVNAERCINVTATPTAAGWYRAASFDAPNNVQNGACGFILDINITRTYGFTNNELHSIRLFGAYNNLQFLNEVSQSNSLGITKIRYTTSSAKAYIDIYSTITTNGNAVTVDIVPHTNPTYIKSLKAESLQSVADAPSGETVSASYDFHWDIFPTVKDISSSVSLSFTSIQKTATVYNGIVDLFIETYFDSYIADHEYIIGSIAAWYAPKTNVFFTGHTVNGSFNPRGLVNFTVYANGTMTVRINNTDGNYPILHATYSIF